MSDEDKEACPRMPDAFYIAYCAIRSSSPTISGEHPRARQLLALGVSRQRTVRECMITPMK
jgi:hypothetical protein